MKVLSTTTGIYNGVSQQTPELRLSNQFTEQINFTFSPVYGLKRRNPT